MEDHLLVVNLERLAEESSRMEVKVQPRNPLISEGQGFLCTLSSNHENAPVSNQHAPVSRGSL